MKKQVLLRTAAMLIGVLCFTACGKKNDVETSTAEPTAQATEEATPAPTPKLTYLERLEQAIKDGDTKYLREELKYWDSAKEVSGQYSINMIADFVDYMNASSERLRSFMQQIEDEFYLEDEERVVLPAVYVYVTTTSDNTNFDFQFFGERTIDEADRKAQKLGPLLPTDYTITASNESWEDSQTAVIPISLSELSDDSSSRHMYYLKFYKTEYTLYPDGDSSGGDRAEESDSGEGEEQRETYAPQSEESEE